MDRVLFIVPPHLSFESFINPAYNERTIVKKSGSYGSAITDMPLGILSMSAYVKKNASVETRLIDFNIILNKIESFEFNSFYELFQDYLSKQEWKDYEPTIVAISTLFTPSYYSMLDIAKACREIFPNAIINAGGGVATNMFNEIFKDHTSFDALCFGEGEKPLLGLIKADDKFKYLESNPSWITREKVEKGESFQYDFIENLDEIPFFDYDIINTDDYGLNPAITAYAPIDNKNQNFYVMTSRGCPHHCCFCSSHTIHGRKMRYHSLTRVKVDLTRLRDEYGAKIIVFQDDHLMGDKKRTFEIINIVNELKIATIFQNGLALYGLDRKMLEALKSAGINQLTLSVESGSERVLKELMHKPLSLSIVRRVVDDCRQLGIYTNLNIIIGLPGETKQDIEDARAFLKTIDPNWYPILCATPLLGTELFDICIKNNYLKGDYIGCDFKNAVIETEDFTADYIQDKAYLLNLELNFVHNTDMRLGNYELALKKFESTIRVKNDHALAYYFAAKCYKMLNSDEKYQTYKAKYQEIIEQSEFWNRYAVEFALAGLD